MAACLVLAAVCLILGSCGGPPATEPQPVQQEPQTMPTATIHTNRLIGETSPYLLQHAHNPVDWYPWGPEAFEKARAEDKPIFLSVGYSACHWCHVMERESFENEEIAAILNAHFISIKVDREERPDVDEIYMTAVQAMTGSGGWPMSVFLTPELEPFFGGTYYPPEDRYGRPGFKSILHHVATVWSEKREDIERGADELITHMRRVLAQQAAVAGELSPHLISNATAQLVQALDPVDGGFGGAPKFPSSPSIALLLREYQRTGDETLLNAATLTLDRMATGGMYDHLGGGFARYSTDAQWLVPHFEKMLYDNAQLAAVYIEAYQLTGNPFYRQVAEETFEYILRDMTGERGEFYCAEDADSEGEEGKFYLWRHDELVELLGAEDAELFSAYYNVKPEGNFRSHESYHAGQNILHTPRDLDSVAADFGIEVAAFRQRLSEMEAKLLAARSERVRPGLDDKALASWNGMMIAALARGYQAFGNERYRDAAVRAADFILADMMEDGALLHSHRRGVSKIPAYLDDYASVIAALIDVYEATFNLRYLDAADELAHQMIDKFWDAERPGFYFTEDRREDLIVRTRPSYDGAVPSGNSVAAMGLLRLARLLDNADYQDRAVKLLEAHHTHMRDMPRGHLVLLLAADFCLFPPKEIAIAGDPDSEGVRALLRALHGAFVPNKVVALVDPADADAAEIGERIPLLAMKTLVGGKPAAYVCKDYACKMPVTAPEALAKELE